MGVTATDVLVVLSCAAAGGADGADGAEIGTTIGFTVAVLRVDRQRKLNFLDVDHAIVTT